LIDGQDLQDVRLRSLREQIALVSQDIVLFDDTLGANIAYGQPADTDEPRIIAAAKSANAWDFIEQLPNGLSTLIGENGVRLSGGERQRLAIARAFFRNSPILILDEATSSLDTIAEQQIGAAIDSLRHGRTTIVIAHKLSTIEDADRILVLDAGQIVGNGTHSELLHDNQIYSALYHFQFSEHGDAPTSTEAEASQH
jgi:subfamily B ATP-binding cassette protein MsbA